MLEQQNPTSRVVKFILAIVSAALLGSIITYWSTNTYEDENALLQKQIADLQTQLETLKNPPAPPPEAILSSLPAGTEIKFDSCDKTSAFSAKNWYAAFVQTAVSSKITTDKIANACYSENGKILVMLIPGSYCTNGTIYRYNITSNTIAKATVDDKKHGCLGWPTLFGKREGTVIKMEGLTGDAGCEAKMYFDYDFIKNIIELKKVGTRCVGPPPGEKWSEYTWTNY